MTEKYSLPAIIENAPKFLREHVANLYFRQREEMIYNITESNIGIWYRLNRDSSQRMDRAKMSLEERAWFLLEAKPYQQESWIRILNQVGSMGAFEATKQPELLQGERLKSWTYFKEYLDSLESSGQVKSNSKPDKSKSSSIRRELFLLCKHETSDFTLNMATNGPLSERIELSKELHIKRENMNYFYPLKIGK